MNGLRRQKLWQVLVMAVVVTAPIIAGSMLLVRFRNRNREDTHAIAYALTQVHAAVESRISEIPNGRGFVVAVERFQRQVQTRQLPVDSVRRFYQAYALAARDGMMDRDDLRQLAPFFGLSVPMVPEDRQPLRLDQSGVTDDTVRALDEE